MYLVDHATRKPPRPENLSERGIIRHIVKSHKSCRRRWIFLSTWHNLGANISRIFNRRHMPND
jgi:hypothetical protein